MAEVAAPRALFAKILRLIAELRPRFAADPGMSTEGNDPRDAYGRGVPMTKRELVKCAPI
jgi:hypothetical protein